MDETKLTEQDLAILRECTILETWNYGFNRGYLRAEKEMIAVVIFYAVVGLIFGFIFGYRVGIR
jgi:hypothetical protein